MKTALSILIAGVFIGGAVMLTRGNGNQNSAPSVNNVSVDGDKQIVEIVARGGYSPKVSLAKADVPTILRMHTQGSFDCSSAVAIPSIGYQANLPPSGVTDVIIPAQKSGTVLHGLCAMGMYHFQVQFN